MDGNQIPSLWNDDSRIPGCFGWIYFSVVSTFLPALEVEFYLEISTLIWVLLFGHYLEARSSSAAGNALQEVAKLLPKKLTKL